MARSGVDPRRVDGVIVGCVSQVGEQSGPVGRWAWLPAGLPESVPSVAVHRACGSSQQAGDFAAQAVIAGACDIVVAAGVESMSRIPMFAARIGQDPFGPSVHQRYAPGLVPQGVSAELVAARWKLDRESIDEFAARSHARRRALTSRGKSCRSSHRTPPWCLTRPSGRPPPPRVSRGSSPPSTPLRWRPGSARSPTGTSRRAIRHSWPTAPAAVLIMGEDIAEELGLTPRARFHAFGLAADDPSRC